MKFAVSLDHLMWEDAETEHEAIEIMRTKLAEMDKDDLSELDFSVVDSVKEEDW